MAVQSLTNKRGSGRIPEFVIGIVVLVATAGLWFGLFGIAPSSVATSYETAVMRGDASAAWPLVYVDRRSSGSNQRALSQNAFAAMLTSKNPNPPSFQVNDFKTGSDYRKIDVDLTYSESGTTKHVTVPVIALNQPFRAHKAYRVDLEVGTLTFGLPKGAGGFTVDGIAVSVNPGGAQSVDVFPGHHRLSLAASPLFAAQTKEVDVSPGKLAPVIFDGALTSKGATAATAAVDSAIAACIAQHSSIPSGCPMSDIAVNTTADVTWQAVGDPASWLSYAIDRDGALYGSGHYQMILTGSSGGRIAEGGPFYVFLEAAGDAFKVTKMYADVTKGVAPATRPSEVTDGAVSASLRTLFAACAASSSYSPVNCPQYTLDNAPVSWSLNGDPLARATVTFDGDHSYFVVRGNCSFTETGRYPKTASGSYVAYVFWDGSALVPVKIVGPLMAN